MPQPGDAFQPQPAAEDCIFELLIETLEGLDDSVRGQFLKQLFKILTRLDLTEAQSGELLVSNSPATRRVHQPRKENLMENRPGRRAFL